MTKLRICKAKGKLVHFKSVSSFCSSDLCFELREAMSLAHQCQITQLKDNFKEKLKSNEDWPKRVEEELNKERAKHLNEMETFETRLKENFHIVFRFFLLIILK